jgi:DNA-binding protein HU-beta
LNNKEFISALSEKTGFSAKDATKWVATVLSVMTQELQDGNSVLIPEFGTFDVKKKMERISVNPTTKQRMLIPPKLALSFKPCVALKEKVK